MKQRYRQKAAAEGPAASKKTPPPALRAPGVFIFILLAVVPTYAPALRAPFYMDSAHAVAGDAAVLATPGVLGPWRAVVYSKSAGRPLTALSFALNHYLLGADPAGYRAVNLALHALAALGLFFLLALLLEPLKYGRRLALLTTLVWAACPVQIQAVTYVVQRAASLSGGLVFWTVFLYLKAARREGKNSALRLAALFLYALSLSAKETALALPLLLAVLEAAGVAEAPGEDANKDRLRRLLGRLAPYFLLALCAGFLYRLRLSGLGQDVLVDGTGGAGGSVPDLAGRILRFGRVSVLYFSLLLWPAPGRLALDRLLPANPSSLFPAALFTLMLLAYGLRYLGKRPALAAVPWFFAALSVEAPLALAPAAEHRLYVASAGVCLLTLLGLHRLFSKNRKALTFAALTLLLALLTATFLRNRLWADPEAFWSAEVRAAPRQVRALVSLANLEARGGRIGRALELYERALAVDPGSREALYNKATTLARAGRAAQALRAFREGRKIHPDDYSLKLGEGLSLRLLGRTEEAYSVYLDLYKTYADAHEAATNLALIHMDRGEYAAAVPYLEAARRARPDLAVIRSNLGNAYAGAGRRSEALEAYRRAIEIDPNYGPAHHNLANLLLETGDVEGAVREGRQAEILGVQVRSARLRALLGNRRSR